MTNEELVARIQAGERDRIPELWAQVEKLVRKHAYKWDRAFDGRNGATLDDYMQAGFIGFLYAVDYYRPDRGSSFAHTLVMCIKTPFRKTAGVWSKVHDPLHEAHSLDAPATTEEDSDPLVEFIVDPQSAVPFLDIEARQLHDALEAALATLTEDEERVLRLLFWHRMTIEQITAELGRSKGYVAAVRDKALRKLRHQSRRKDLWECWKG